MTAFLSASSGKSFSAACAEIDALCHSTGQGCVAYQFFCEPTVSDDRVCLRLFRACREGRKSACSSYDARCLSPNPPAFDAGPAAADSTAPPLPPPPPADAGAAAPDSAALPPPAGIWKPAPGTTWQWQLTGSLDTSVQATMFDIDLFDTSAQTIATLKGLGRIVICYFSAGSYEDWRPDAKDIPSAARGSKMSGWNELWLDIRHPDVQAVMAKRLDLAQTKGCHGVEPDNVDGYTNNTGFALTAADQLDQNKFLAAEAHKRGLSIGLKNDLDQVKALEPFFDWALNEECLHWNECDLLKPFIAAGKAVFHTEYTGTKSSVCSKTAALQFSTLIKKLDLGVWYEACWQ